MNSIDRPITRRIGRHFNPAELMDRGASFNRWIILAIKSDLCSGHCASFKIDNFSTDSHWFIQTDCIGQTLSTPGATSIRWLRGGAAPEVSLVVFELSTDGGATWTMLGAGTRMPAVGSSQD